MAAPKRKLSGRVEVGDYAFRWTLHREPQWTSEQGFRGLAIAVVLDEPKEYRTLILEWPYEKSQMGMALIPQRPAVSIPELQAGIASAMETGWEPESRGKPWIRPAKAEG